MVASGQVSFYSALDSVLFRPDQDTETLRRQRLVAPGWCITGLLVCELVPLLSQTQAFDSPVLLEPLRSLDGDARAVRGLVETGRLQVRVFDGPGLRPAADEAERFTLLNAFCSALDTPGFLFSAWPEFEDSDLRQAVLAQLDARVPELDLGHRDLEERLEALRDLDGALRRSEVSERAFPGHGPTLFERVAPSLLALHAPSAAGAALQRLVEVARQEQLTRPVTRSRWYGLLEDGLLPDHPAVHDESRGVVDACYNQVIALSLDPASVSVTECGSDRIAGVVARAGAERSVVAADLLEDPRRSEWLTWAETSRLLDELSGVSGPVRRGRHLVERHAHYVARTDVEGNAALALLIGAPPAVVGTGAGILGGLAAGASGMALGEIVTGAVALLAALPAAGRGQRWLEDRLVAKRLARYSGRGDGRRSVVTEAPGLMDRQVGP